MRKRFGARFLAGILTLALSVGALAVVPAAAQAQQQRRLQFIRDAEIEHTIRTFAQPIFEAAGIDGESVEIALVRDSSVNAFVAGGMNLFIHTGLLQESRDAGQLVGVLAHEIGHIAGGHLVRGNDAMEGASAQAILATLLGVAAAVGSGNAGAGAAVIMGGQEMARRSLLSFSRTQESAADQAGLSYLDRAGLSAKGMLAFLENLGSQEGLSPDRQAEFVRTHPLTHDRIDSVRHHVESARATATPVSAEWAELHRRLRAKLAGFIQPMVALRQYRADDASVAARYARAVAFYQRGDLKQALPLVDGLITQEPKNPFFHELKGQMLLENSRVAESLAPYRRSVELLPKSALLRTALAHALLETNDPKLLDEARKHLDASLQAERDSPFTWRLMATVWGRKGDQGMIAYAMAEEAIARGDKAMARAQADKALNLLARGSPGWLRAQDIRGIVGGKS